MKSQRTRIKNRFRDLLEPEFKRVFRGFEVGAWRPGRSTRPWMTIVDNGQQRGDATTGDADNRVLSLHVTLDIDTSFDEEVIAQIIALIDDREDIGCGTLYCRYKGDDPFTVIISGSPDEQQVWIIEFEVEYVAAR